MNFLKFSCWLVVSFCFNHCTHFVWIQFFELVDYSLFLKIFHICLGDLFIFLMSGMFNRYLLIWLIMLKFITCLLVFCLAVIAIIESGIFCLSIDKFFLNFCQFFFIYLQICGYYICFSLFHCLKSWYFYHYRKLTLVSTNIFLHKVWYYIKS